MKNSEINKLILFSIVLFAFFLIFACIEMRPREGLSTQVNAIVESGSDICTGYTEETCGAFTKEKRTATTRYTCKGVEGPADYKSCFPNVAYGYLKPVCEITLSATPPCQLSSSEPIGDADLGFNEYCNPDCSKKSTAPTDVTCSVVGEKCKVQISPNPTTVCLTEEYSYDLPVDNWDCKQETSSFQKVYDKVSNSITIKKKPDTNITITNDMNVYFTVPNVGVNNVKLNCGLQMNCPVFPSGVDTYGSITQGYNIAHEITNITVIGVCGGASTQQSYPVILKSGLCTTLVSTNYVSNPFSCAFERLFLQPLPGTPGSNDALTLTGIMNYNIISFLKFYCGDITNQTTWVLGCDFKIECTPVVTYEGKWTCNDVDRGRVYKFADCQSPNKFSTFQGGFMYLRSGIPYSQLSNELTSFYNGSGSTKQIPFFMIGQGPTFDDFEKAKKVCNPFEDIFFNVSLGNTTFDPPDLIVPKGTDVCFENIDEKEHTVTITDDNFGLIASPTLSQKKKECSSLPLGNYLMEDSSFERGTIKIRPSDEDSIFFVSDRIVPDYGLVTEGKRVNFSLTSSDIPEHKITISPDNQDCSISTSSPQCSIPDLPLGEHGIKDSATNADSKLFVQSQTDTFLFKYGEIEPGPRDIDSNEVNKKLSFIARPFGDRVCFSAVQGLEGTCGAIVTDWKDDETFCNPTMGTRCFDNVTYLDFKPECSQACTLSKSTPISEGQPNFGKYCVSTSSTCIKATDLPDVKCEVVAGKCTASIKSNPTTTCVEMEVTESCSVKSEFEDALLCQPNPAADKCQFQITNPQSPSLCDSTCKSAYSNVECKKGFYVSIFRENEVGNWEVTEKDKEIPIEPGQCCLESPIPGYYKADTNDGREVRFLISSQRPTATINVRGIGFVPPYATVGLGTQICWTNPSYKTRSISFLQNSNLPITGFETVCTDRLGDIGVYTAKFPPPLEVSAQIEVKDIKTYFINVLAYGFDPPFVTAKPGDIICWKNVDEKEHTLITEDGSRVILGKDDTNCIQHADNGVYYSRTDIETNVTSVATSYVGYGMFVTPFGLYPFSLVVPKSTQTYSTPIVFLNKIGEQANFIDSQNIILTSSDVQPRDLLAMTNINITLANYDNRPHSITVYDTSGAIVLSRVIPVDSSNENFVVSFSGRIVDNTLAPTIGANATSVITIVGPSLKTIPAGQSFTWYAPQSTGTFTLTETMTGTPGSLTIAEPEPEKRKEPIFNETMDLPVQQISGMLTSEQLFKMREYANRGLVSVIIPTYGDQVVKIKTEAFDPEQLNVSAGSTVMWDNIDNAPHKLIFNIQNFSRICSLRNPDNQGDLICKYDDSKRICLAKMINPTSECFKFEKRNSVKCASNLSLVGAVSCRPSDDSPTAECEVSITNPSNAGLRDIAKKYCNFYANNFTCSIKSEVNPDELQGMECMWDINAPTGYMCTLRNKDYTIWSVAGVYTLSGGTSNAVWNTSYPFCNRTSVFDCDINPVYKSDFVYTTTCSHSPATDSCILSKNDFTEDLNETYCMKELFYQDEEPFSKTLQSKESYSETNMIGNTIWNITDETSKVSSTVNVERWDVDLFALFRPFQPDLAEISSDSYIEFQSYMPSSATLSGKYDATPTSVTIPAFGGQRENLAGYAIWFPKGSFAYFKNVDDSTTNIYVRPPFESTIFNLTVDPTGFKATTPASSGKVATLSVYPGSQVCVRSTENRHVRVLKDNKLACGAECEGDTFGVIPPASDVCLPVYACQDRYEGIKCSGEIITTDTDPYNDFCNYTITNELTRFGDTDTHACIQGYGASCEAKSGSSLAIRCTTDPVTNNCVYQPVSNKACLGTQSNACQPKTAGVSCNYDSSAPGGAISEFAKCSFSPVNTNGNIPCSGSNCQPCGSAGSCSSAGRYSDVECVSYGGNCYVGPFSGSGVTYSTNQYCNANQNFQCTDYDICTMSGKGTGSISCSCQCTVPGDVRATWLTYLSFCGEGSWCQDYWPGGWWSGFWLPAGWFGDAGWPSCYNWQGNPDWAPSGWSGARPSDCKPETIRPLGCWKAQFECETKKHGERYQSWAACECYHPGQVDSTCYPAPTGSLTCYNTANTGSRCEGGGYSCYYNTAAGAIPKQCTTFDKCPCIRCSVKYPGPFDSQNYACTVSGGQCNADLIGNGWTPDRGYCNRVENVLRCTANSNFSGAFCYTEGTGCAVSDNQIYDINRDKCMQTQTARCDSTNPKITCDYSSSTGCYISKAPDGFCWTPDKTGEYAIEDVSSGQKVYVNVYNRLEPLVVSVQRSVIAPSIATTSPGSEVCISSADGQIHKISTPPALRTLLDSFIDATNTRNCFSLPEGKWTLNMADEGMLGIPGSSTIASTTTNSTVDVRYTVFDPEFAIMRLGHNLTFTNIDAINHTICLADTIQSRVEFSSDNGGTPITTISNLLNFHASEKDFLGGNTIVITEENPGKCGGTGKSCLNDSECTGLACVSGTCAIPGVPHSCVQDSECKTCKDVSGTKTGCPSGNEICETKTGYEDFDASCTLSGSACAGSVTEIKGGCESGTYNISTGKCDTVVADPLSCSSVSKSEDNSTIYPPDSYSCLVNDFVPSNPSCTGTLSDCSISCTQHLFGIRTCDCPSPAYWIKRGTAQLPIWYCVTQTSPSYIYASALGTKTCTKTCTCCLNPTSTISSTDPTNKTILDKYCDYDCKTKSGAPTGVNCFINTDSRGGCKVTVDPSSIICGTTTPACEGEEVNVPSTAVWATDSIYTDFQNCNISHVEPCILKGGYTDFKSNCTLSSDRTKCEGTATEINSSCPSGSGTYNTTTGYCEKTVTSTSACLPDSGTYNTTNGKCEKTVTASNTCSSGTVYNTSTRKCEKYVEAGYSICRTGTSYNTGNGKCEWSETTTGTCTSSTSSSSAGGSSCPGNFWPANPCSDSCSLSCSSEGGWSCWRRCPGCPCASPSIYWCETTCTSTCWCRPSVCGATACSGSTCSYTTSNSEWPTYIGFVTTYCSNACATIGGNPLFTCSYTPSGGRGCTLTQRIQSSPTVNPEVDSYCDSSCNKILPSVGVGVACTPTSTGCTVTRIIQTDAISNGVFAFCNADCSNNENAAAALVTCRFVSGACVMNQVIRTTPDNNATLSKYCNNDCSTKSTAPANVACSKNTNVGCIATVSSTSSICGSTTPDFAVSGCTPKISGIISCRVNTDKTGCEYVYGSCGGDGKDCLGDSECSDSVCTDGTCGTGPACSDSECGTCVGAASNGNVLPGICGQYGNKAKNYSLSFSLPSYTLGMSIDYSFNDNGIIFVNGNMLLNNLDVACRSGSDTKTLSDRVYVPSGYLKLNDINKIDFIDCDCGGNWGIDTSIRVDAVSTPGCTDGNVPGCGQFKHTFIPGETLTIPDLENREKSCVYIDNDFQRAFKVEVKECTGSDVTNIASAIYSYERADYNTIACDAGLDPKCSSYNPYGPATTSILTTEKGLDLTKEDDLACANDQIANIKSHCLNCASALYVGKTNYNILNNALEEQNIKSSADIIAHSMFLNEYPSCSIEDIINEKIGLAKLALYNYSKTSIILELGVKEGKSTVSSCAWTNDSIISAYTDFYDTWIPIMAGSGIIGAAQHCYEDPCPTLSYYGLYDKNKNEKAYTSTWFKEGCGKYYYEAEGLSPLTFSTYETNYSVCDPSRMFALIQQTKCLEQNQAGK